MNKEIKFLSVDVGYNDESYLVISTYVKNKFLRIDKKFVLSKTMYTSDIAEYAIEIFNQYNCNYLIVEGLGSELAMIDKLNYEIHPSRLITVKYSPQTVSNSILMLMHDINRNRLLFNYDNRYIAEVYKNNGEFINTNSNGLLKISSTVDENLRKTLQLLNKIYKGIYIYERDLI